MSVLNYILAITGVYTSLWMIEMKYVWMNEEDFVFVKQGSLVEIPYVEPLFLGSLDIKSMLLRSHGIWMNYMKNVMFNMQYFMCSVQDVVCFVQYDKYDDECYSHGITFLIQIWKVHSLLYSQFYNVTNITNQNLASTLTWLSIIML